MLAHLYAPGTSPVEYLRVSGLGGHPQSVRPWLRQHRDFGNDRRRRGGEAFDQVATHYGSYPGGGDR